MESISKKQWIKYNILAFEGQWMVGVILTLWNPQSMNLLAIEAMRHTLSVNMQIIGNSEVILCTNVYGPLGEKKENACRPRKSKGYILQPPLDLGRGLQHNHNTCREKRGPGD
jgi:hypothetical protein